MADWNPQLEHLRESDFPEGVLRDILRLIGTPATVALVDWRGGAVLSVPRHLKERHPIVRVLGPDAASALARHFGGCRVYIPSRNKLLRPLRTRCIRADYDSGVPVPSLVQRYGVSERHVRAVLKEA